MGRRVIDGCHDAISTRLDHFSGIYGALSAGRRASGHPASRAFSYGTYALYREKTLHESCQVLIEHARRVAKIQVSNPGRIALHVKCKQSAKKSHRVELGGFASCPWFANSS